MAKARTIRRRDQLAAEIAATCLDLRAARTTDQVREQPPEPEPLTCRSLELRADSADEKTRSVAATIATENQVLVRDNATWELIDEVLRMDGVVIPERVAMLNNHYRYSIDDVLGSIREMKVEAGVLVGRCYFATGAEDSAEQRAWAKAREGHLTDVSVGYRTVASVDIPAGQSADVGGRRYTAGARRLRVTTRWEVREVSLVPVGADIAAKIREVAEPLHQFSIAKGSTVNKQLRAYLESLGLRTDADEAAAQAFWRALQGDQRTRADALAAEPNSAPAPSAVAAEQRSTPTAPAPVPATPAAPAAPTADQIRAEAAAAERRRLARIQELGPGVSQEIVQRAIDEGMDEARFAPLFLQSLRDSRSPAVPPAGGNVGIHSRSTENSRTVDALQGAMLLRRSTPLDRPAFGQLRSIPDRIPNWLRLDVNHDARQATMENAHRLADLSLVDLCRECVRLDGRTSSANRDDMIRSAVSGGSLTAIFTGVVNAELLSSYTEYPDSTRGWVAETDVPDFKTDERAAMGKFGALSKHARGGEAGHLDIGDSKESSRIARYSGQWVIDEMDIIDDRFGAIEQASPGEMGNSAAALRPDLIYAILLANAALDADSVALFHSTHANTATNALSATNLEAGIAAMGKQRIRARALNVRPRFLLVPQDLRFSADIYLTSAQRFDGSSTGTAGGVKNPLAEQGIVAIADDRIGAAGCTDPVTGTAYTGSATNWYLAARPGENGAKTLVCKYRRGTGRMPSIRSWIRDRGTWGIGFDIVHDIGADADDFRGLYRGNT